jgi:hypothetical protein
VMAYSLRVGEPHDLDAESCPFCGHPLPGWHRDAKCEGLQHGGSGRCFVLHATEKGVRRCPNNRSHDIGYRLNAGGRHHYFAVKHSSGIYCESCAGRVAHQATLSGRRQEA